MKRESQMSQRIAKAFPMYERVENKVMPGTADVYYSLHGLKDTRTDRTWTGWMELKYMLKFPKSGVVEIPHYTREQAAWLGDKWKRGIMAHLVVGVGERIHIFRGGNPIVTAGPHVWTVAAFEEYADDTVPLRDGRELVVALVSEHAIASDAALLHDFWKYQECV